MVPVGHEGNRIGVIINPGSGYLHHVFVRFEVSPGCGVVSLHIEPFLKRCLIGIFCREKGCRHYIGQLNFHDTFIGQVRCDNIDTSTKGVYDFRDGIIDGEGIGYAEETSRRIAAGAFKCMGSDKYFESLVHHMFGHPDPAEITGSEVVSGWSSGRR